MKIILLILLCLISLSSYGEENKEFSVYWNCYLPDDTLVCADLRSAYFAAHGNLSSASDETEAFLSITLRSIAGENSVHYLYTFQGQGSLPDYSADLGVNSILTDDEKFEKVLSMLNKWTEIYQMFANEETTAPAKDVPYYFSPNVFATGSRQQGSRYSEGYAKLPLNYSTNKWRVVGEVGAGAFTNSSDTTAYNKGIKSKVVYIGESVAVIRSLSKHWDIAIFANDLTVKNEIIRDGDISSIDPDALENTARQSAIKLGAEWILIPFTTDQSNGNFAVRYSLGGERHSYVDPSAYEYIKEYFIRHTLELYFQRHYSKIDVKLSVGAFFSNFRDKELRGLSGNGQINYKINKRVTLGANLSMTYSKNPLLSPAGGNSFSFTGYTSQNWNALNYSGSLTLRYTLGNVRLFNREQRWKN